MTKFKDFLKESGKGHPMPKEAKGFDKYYQGYHADVKGPDGKMGHHVFEFPSDEQHERFLEKVGGAPHPLGGRRAILR